MNNERLTLARLNGRACQKAIVCHALDSAAGDIGGHWDSILLPFKLLLGGSSCWPREVDTNTMPPSTRYDFQNDGVKGVQEEAANPIGRSIKK
jgi:hypothetical protein